MVRLNSNNLTLKVGSRCLTGQCLNGARCIETLSGSTASSYCNCRPGFTGVRCETGNKKIYFNINLIK